jgi:hypothetical protein
VHYTTHHLGRTVDAQSAKEWSVLHARVGGVWGPTEQQGKAAPPDVPPTSGVLPSPSSLFQSAEEQNALQARLYVLGLGYR